MNDRVIKPLRILCVDDDEDTRVLLQTALSGQNHVVTTAADGNEALSKIGEEDIDVVLTDILIPHIDGFQLAKAIKNNRETRHIIVILITGTYLNETDKTLGAAMGADEFLYKPIDPDVIVDTVKRLSQPYPMPTIAKHPAISGEATVKLYNEVIFRKLNEKVEELKTEITTRKKLEMERYELIDQVNQLRQTKSVGLIAAAVASEINNMLSVVQGYTLLCKEHTQNNDVRQLEGYLDHIHESCEDTKQFIQQLLVFSGYYEKQQPLNLNTYLNDIAPILDTSITAPAGHILKRNISPDKIVINFNSTALTHSLVDLVMNAKEAMSRPGEITVSLTVDNISNEKCISCGSLIEGKYATVSVSDTGPGIDNNDLKKIFDPYYSKKNPEQPAGIGLTRIHDLVHDNKGHITISSSKKGTTVNLLLPTEETL